MIKSHLFWPIDGTKSINNSRVMSSWMSNSWRKLILQIYFVTFRYDVVVCAESNWVTDWLWNAFNWLYRITLPAFLLHGFYRLLNPRIMTSRLFLEPLSVSFVSAQSTHAFTSSGKIIGKTWFNRKYTFQSQ